MNDMNEMSSVFERFVRSYETSEVIFEEGNEGHEMFTLGPSGDPTAKWDGTQLSHS